MLLNRLFFNLFKKNIEEVKRGGLKIVFRKILTIIKIILQIPFYLLSLIVILLIYLVEPLIMVRFISIESGRLGHFLANTEIFLCEKDAGINIPKQKYFDIFFFNDICNKQIAKMWKRELFIVPRFFIFPIYNLNKILTKIFPRFKKHIAGSLQSDRDVYNLLEKSKPHIHFTEKELKYGEEFLKKCGLSKKTKYICLIVRDAAYLKEKYPEKNWSFHDYRNYEIENFYEAAETLTKRGYFVFRMGSKVEKKFSTENKMIVDYANLPDRSDFLDVYLGANCSFCISTSCGFDAIPFVFRKPIAYITVPIQHFFTSSKNFLIISKHHFSENLNKKLSFSEILKVGATDCENSNDYKNKNITLIENSSEEIKDFSLEMLDRYENKWIDDKNNIEMQKIFWKKYYEDLLPLSKAEHLHGKLLARMSITFLKKNPEWLS